MGGRHSRLDIRRSGVQGARLGVLGIALAVLLSSPATATAPNVPPRVDRLAEPGTHAVTLTPVADTFADSMAGGTNFGSTQLMPLGQRGADTRAVYLSFDVAGLPANVTDLRAVLAFAPTVSQEVTVRAHATTSFDEHALTWRDRPPVGDALDAADLPIDGIPVVLDVSDVVSGNGTVSLALTADGTAGGSTWLPSRESALAASQLRLTWRGDPVAREMDAGLEPGPTEAPSPEPPDEPSPEPTEDPVDSPPEAPGLPTVLQPGQSMLLGATVLPHDGRESVEAEIAHLEGDQAALEIRRVFDPAFTGNFMAKGGLDVGKRTTHYSFKPDMAALARGELDSKLQAFLDSIPAEHPTILTIWHEPEDNFTTEDEQETYRTGWRHFAELVKAQNRPELSTSWVMMAYSWSEGSGRDPMDWWPGDGLVDIVGIDTYNEGSLQGTRWDSPGRGFGDPFDGDQARAMRDGQSIVEWLDERDARFGIAELGSLENTSDLTAAWTETPSKADWIREAVEYFHSLGAVYVEYFHAGPHRGPWWLDAYSAEPLHVFRDLLAQHSVDP